MNYIVDHLGQLESEAIFVIREAVCQFERPALLFSGGKDSIVLTRLAQKAFWPAKVPFPVMHIDTGHNFPEALEFRDRFVKQAGVDLIVRSVEDSIRTGRVREEKTINGSRNMLQSVTLLDAIEEFKFDAAFGGARRDEEKARAKERFFSHRDEFGQWDPKNQRPELWNLFNGRKRTGEHFRVFPLSNWTELDVWNFIRREKLDIPSVYFSHRRLVLDRGGTLLAQCERIQPLAGEKWTERTVRFRTVGDMTCTGAIESVASTIDEIIDEITLLRTSERGTRADDRFSEAAMEDRKKEGYF